MIYDGRYSISKDLGNVELSSKGISDAMAVRIKTEIKYKDINVSKDKE